MQPEPLAGVVAPEPSDRPTAADLARRLDVPLLEASPGSGLVLQLGADGLGLLDAGASHALPLRVDLLGGPLGERLRRQPGRKEPLARAVGAGRGRALPRVLDATGGLLRDATILAWIGCRVRVLERHPVLSALAADGLRRAAAAPELAELLERLELIQADAREWLAEHADAVEVVLIDPMFPERRKAALVKQPMRWLRRLTGPDEDATELLQQARAVCGRVVVKRPRGAPPLADGRSLQVDAGQVRFDVWLG